MAGKQGENKPKKLSSVGTTKRKEILVLKIEQEIFQATKLVIEITSSKPLRLEVDQTAKPNQTSLVLCLCMVQFYLLPCLPPPRAYSWGFAILFSFGSLFPTPGHVERDNSPPPGLLIDHKYVVLCTLSIDYDIDFRTITKPDVLIRT